MFPIQPPKSRNPPKKLTLNTKAVNEPENAEPKPDFANDVMLSIQSNAHEMSSADWLECFKTNEIEELREIGEGSGGKVRLCKLIVNPAKPYAIAARKVGMFALKEIPANPDPNLRKQVLRELQINKGCDSPFIVKYHGAFLVEEMAQIFIAMEYCHGSSLDAILNKVKEKQGRIGEKVLACIASSVLQGITYLYSRKIIHRDIKPQNILLTGNGDVKLCDFGVSGEVVNSLVTTFTGTSYYMAPERIRGQPYTVTSDVWSLGLTLMELAINRFPFECSKPLTPIELLSQIVNQPSPELPVEDGIKWSESFKHFLHCCLEKDSKKRPNPQKLLTHPFIVGHAKKKCNMKAFVEEAWS